MHFYAEVEEVDGFQLVRVHRTWYGRPPPETKERTFEKANVPDYVSDDPTVHVVALEPDEVPEGMSVKLKGGLVLTAEPERYGDPLARVQAGKKAPIKLVFEEWVPLIW
jgi:hypothetical protein